MESILDFTTPVDVAAFDRVVQAMSSSSHEIMKAQEVLTKFKEHPDAFMRVDVLLMNSTCMATRFFALQVLNDAAQSRWYAFANDQRLAIREFVVNLIVRECVSRQRIREQRVLLNKMNSTLVSIAKREWPARWPTFITDVCASAMPSEPLTENNLCILRLMGEEIFEFGEKTMTSRWIARRKEAFKNDFRAVFHLCLSVLSSEDSVLKRTSLETLSKFVTWCGPELVFEERLLGYLAQLVVGDEVLRLAAVRCFAEVCAVKTVLGANGDAQRQLLEVAFRKALGGIIACLPITHSNPQDRIMQLYTVGNEADRQFVDNVCQLIVAFLTNYLSLIAYDDVLLQSVHQMLVGMSLIPNKDMFKTCVEYWCFLGDLLAHSTHTVAIHKKLSRVLSGARYALIKNMAKPEEIIIVEEDGELRREHMADVEALQMYAQMKEALVLLTQIDPKDTQNLMRLLMQKLLDGSEWGWHNCNTLSWAFGAISLTMSEEEESVLFNDILTGLLRLCNQFTSRDDRAVIASNIMFIVGQYPRYLRSHPNFLVTVVRKVFEFMAESFHAVQEMAVDTFLKLTKEVPEMLVCTRGPSGSPFAMEVANEWGSITSRLSPTLVQTSFTAVGHIIAAATATDRETLLATFMRTVNSNFKVITSRAGAQGGEAVYADEAVMAELLHYLRVFSSVASTCGTVFIHEMHEIIWELHGLYRTFGETQRRLLDGAGGGAMAKPTADAARASGLGAEGDGGVAGWSAGAAVSGAKPSLTAAQQREMKGLRLSKREILRIFEKFVKNTTEIEFVASKCMPDIFSVVLLEYERSPVETKEAGALNLVTACVNRLGSHLNSSCAAILDHVFDSTVTLICHNMEDYPEFRINLFRLIHALTDRCFPAFVEYVATKESVVDGLLWAIKHTEFTIMKTGLETLDGFLCQVMQSPFAQAFIRAYTQRILTEVMVAAMDSLHAAGFPYQCRILTKLFSISLKCPPHEPIVGHDAVMAYLTESLIVIPTLTPTLISTFVENCYTTCCDFKAFQTNFADFLIEVQIWEAEQENLLLKQEQLSLPSTSSATYGQLSLTMAEWCKM